MDGLSPSPVLQAGLRDGAGLGPGWEVEPVGQGESTDMAAASLQHNVFCQVRVELEACLL